VIPGRIPFPLGLAIAAAAVAACALVGGMFTARTARGWYLAIAKPPWTPSGRVIGTVWAILFALIAVAAALVWDRAFDVRFTSALALNLLLNVLWSWLFFAHKSPPAALVELCILEVTCVALAALALRISPAAGGLLLPYVGWVAFACVLNGVVVRMNSTRPRRFRPPRG